MALLIVFHDQRMDSKAIYDFKTSLRYRTTQVSGSPGWRLQWNNLPDWLDGAPILKLFCAHPLSLSLAQCPRDLFRPPRTHPGLPRGRACTKTPRKASIFPSLSRLSCQQWLSFVFHCCWDPYTTTMMRHCHFTVEKFWFRRVLSYLGKGWWPQKLQTRSEGDSSSFNAIRHCLLKPIWEGGHWRYFKQWVGVQWKGVD